MQFSSLKRTVTQGYAYARTQLISTIGNLLHFPFYSPAPWAHISQAQALSHRTMD